MIPILSILLIFLLIFVGRMQSKKIILTLIYNTLMLLGTSIFIIFRLEPLWIGCIAFLGISSLTLFYQNGFNSKTISTFLSLLLVVGMLSLLTWFLCVHADICGLNSQTSLEDEILVLDLHLRINMIHVTFVMTLLGLLGSVKDSAMAVVTGTNEVHRNQPELSRKDLFWSGMHIGKDILGITISTLFFAGIGESVLLVQMYYQYQFTFAEILNSKSLFQACILMLLGGIGVELSIPISSFIFAALCSKSSIALNQNKNASTLV